MWEPPEAGHRVRDPRPDTPIQPPDHQVFPGRGMVLVFLGVLNYTVPALRLLVDTENADMVVLRGIARYLLVCKLLRALLRVDFYKQKPVWCLLVAF